MPPRRKTVLTHERFARVPPQGDVAQRELNAVREIVHAFVHADRPEEVFQFALDRTSPLIGASFASVYLLEGVSELMRLVAAYNWPEKHRPWLADMRVRIGFGPSGEAAAERRVIEVPDVAADGGLEDWAEVARELGFRSLVALPLQNARGALGAVTFYFATEGAPTPERRNLMHLVADQMAATAEKSRLVQELRRSSAALADAREALEREVGGGPGATDHLDDLWERLAAQVAEPLRRIEPRTAPVDLVLARWDEVDELRTARDAGVPLDNEPCEVRDLVASASRLADEWVGGSGIPVTVAMFDVPDVVADRRKLVRILASLLVLAGTGEAAGTAGGGWPVNLSVAMEGRVLQLVVRSADAAGHAPELGTDPFAVFAAPGIRARGQLSPALAREFVTAMGGSLDLVNVPGQGPQFTCSIPQDPTSTTPRTT